MPLDAVTQGGRYIRRMPWVGHNAAIIAAREAPHRLPPGWGHSFVHAPYYPGVAEAPPGVVARPEPLLALCAAIPVAQPLRYRIMDLLRALAVRGMTLPRIPDMAAALNSNDNSMSAALIALGKNGQIQRWAGAGAFAGERAIRLCDTGEVVRSALAPDRIAFAS